MKNKIFVMINACIVTFAAMLFSACNAVIDTEDGRTKGISVLPSSIEAGITVSISGTNFKNATAVVFPDNIVVNTFEKFGDFQINVVVPEGVRSGGNIIVRLPGGDVTVPTTIKVNNPVAAQAYPSHSAVHPENGLYWAGPYDDLIINGSDLENVREIIFPGGEIVKNMDFRSGSERIVVRVPLYVDRVIAKLELITSAGTSIFSENEIDWTSLGYVPPDIFALTAGTSKSWTWDFEGKDNPLFMEGTGYGLFEGMSPSNWNVPAFSTGEGEGATMTFSREGRNIVLQLNRTNGNTANATGFVDLNMNYNATHWNLRIIGRMQLTDVRPLNATGGDFNEVFLYDILRLTEDQLVLGNPRNGDYSNQWGTYHYYYFRAVDDDD